MPKIAVVDDDPVVIDLLKGWLNEILPNCEVVEYFDLKSALVGIEATDFDLVVSDVDLGSGSDKFGGVQIAAALDTSRSPLLVVTGFTVQEGVFRALGAWDYLQKPISEADFKREVRRALVYRRGLTDAATGDTSTEFPLVPDLQVSRHARDPIHWKGHRIHLPMSKIDIVVELAKRAGTVVTHKELFEHIVSGKNLANLRVKISEIREEFRSVDPTFESIQPVVVSGYLWRVD